MPSISPTLMAILRCPYDPSNTRVLPEDDHLVCERCGLRFAIKDGFPDMVVEEALLPAGCEALSDLPCQRELAHPKSS